MNILKTTLLLGVLTGFFILIGGAVGGTGGMMIALIFALLLNFGSWWFSDSIVLRLSRAREVTPQEAPELHQMVETLAARANMPKPRVYLMDTDMPNAFATGRSPQKGAVAVTTGIMRLLNKDELAGVIAHELAHIKHRDTLISSIAATFAGAVGMLADMAMWAMIFGGFGGDDEDEGPAGIVGGILTIMLAPMIAVIIQLAISRSREFAADAGAARLMGDPMPLVNALRKLDGWKKGGHVNPATASLYIVNPLSGGGLTELFSTHPRTEKRIENLMSIPQLATA